MKGDTIMKYCHNYTGVACIDGHCPKANEDELWGRGEDVPHNCRECWYYMGCVDCYFNRDEICEITKEPTNEETAAK